MMEEESTDLRAIVGMLETIAHRDKFLLSPVCENNDKWEKKVFI